MQSSRLDCASSNGAPKAGRGGIPPALQFQGSAAGLAMRRHRTNALTPPSQYRGGAHRGNRPVLIAGRRRLLHRPPPDAMRGTATEAAAWRGNSAGDRYTEKGEIASTYCPRVPVLSPPLSPPATQAHASAANPHGYWDHSRSAGRSFGHVPASPPPSRCRSPSRPCSAPPCPSWGSEGHQAQREEEPARAPLRAQQKGAGWPLVGLMCAAARQAARPGIGTTSAPCLRRSK